MPLIWRALRANRLASASSRAYSSTPLSRSTGRSGWPAAIAGAHERQVQSSSAAARPVMGATWADRPWYLDSAIGCPRLRRLSGRTVTYLRGPFGLMRQTRSHVASAGAAAALRIRPSSGLTTEVQGGDSTWRIVRPTEIGVRNAARFEALSAVAPIDRLALQPLPDSF
jgi:hypothetical protein